MKKQENKIVVFLSSKLYSLEAVYGAAYVFLDRAYVYLEEAPESKIKATLKSKNKLAGKESEGLKDEFLNELLNFSLREQISKSNKKIREYIVARALSAASAAVIPERRPMGQEDNQRRKLSEGIIPWTGERFQEKPSGEKEKIWAKDPLGIAVPLGQEDNQKRELSEGVIPWTGERFQEKPSGEKEKIWVKDPLGIAIPWEEKYLAKKQTHKKKCK